MTPTNSRPPKTLQLSSPATTYYKEEASNLKQLSSPSFPTLPTPLL